MSTVLCVINFGDGKKIPDFRLSIWINFCWICTFWNIIVIPFKNYAMNCDFQERERRKNNVCRYMRVFLHLVFSLAYSHAYPIHQKCLVFSKFLLFICWMFRFNGCNGTRVASKSIQCIGVRLSVSFGETNNEFRTFFLSYYVLTWICLSIEFLYLDLCSHWTLCSQWLWTNVHSFACIIQITDAGLVNCIMLLIWHKLNNDINPKRFILCAQPTRSKSTQSFCSLTTMMHSSFLHFILVWWSM